MTYINHNTSHGICVSKNQQFKFANEYMDEYLNKHTNDFVIEYTLICVMNDLLIYTNSLLAGKIYIQNIYSGKLIRVLKEPNIYRLMCIGDNIITLGLYGTISIFDITKPSDEECIHVLRGHIGIVFSVCELNNLIVSCGRDKTIRVWDLDKSNCGSSGKECIRVLEGHTYSVSAICVKDNLIISGSCDKTIRIWDLDRSIGEECICILEGHIWHITSICIKDNLIISGSNDDIRVWDINKSISEPRGCEPIRVLNGHKFGFLTICNKDNLIISRAINNLQGSTICIWDITKPVGDECVRILHGYNNNVDCICVKDNLIISCSNQILVTPITLYSGEHELFTRVMNNYYKLFANLASKIWGYFELFDSV